MQGPGGRNVSFFDSSCAKYYGKLRIHVYDEFGGKMS